MRVVFLNTKRGTDLRDDLAKAAITEGRALTEEDYKAYQERIKPKTKPNTPKTKSQQKESKEPIETKELKGTKKTK